MTTQHWNGQGSFRGAAAASIALIVYASLYPFVGWSPLPDDIWSRMLEASRDPQITDIAGNLLFYAPSGFLLTFAFSGRWRIAALLSLPLLSTAMEITQAALPGRTPSLLDIIMNTTGTAVGAAAAIAGRNLMSLFLDALRLRLRKDIAGRACLIALSLWALAQLSPFIPTIEMGHLRHEIASFLTVPTGGLSERDLLRQSLALLVIGLAARRGSVRAGPPAAVLVMAALTLIAHASIIGQHLSPEIFLGTLVGGLAAFLLPPLHDRPKGLFIAALAIALIAVDWRPPEPGMWQPMNLIPFFPQINDPLRGITDILDGMWPYAALTAGLLLAVRRPAFAAATGLLLSAAIAATLELSQRLATSGYPDITDVITAIAGSACVLAAVPKRQPSVAPSPSDQRPTDFSISRSPGSGKPRP